MHYPKEFRISLSLGTEPDDSAQFEKELKEIGTYAENYLKDNKIDVKNEESQTVIDVAALPRKIFPCRAKSRRQRPMQNFMRCFPVCRRNINIYFFCIMDRDFEQERLQRFWISVRTR